MAYTIKLRRDTAANWTTINPVLSEGEFGFEQDTLKFKIGDGSTLWNSLGYIVSEAVGGAATIITEYEATEGQDEFVLPSLPTPGTVRVKRNGLQQKSDHWSLTDLTVTLVTPCVAGEDVVIEQDGPAEIVYGVGPPGADGADGVDGVDATRGAITINNQTGTSYTLVGTDATKWIRLNNASAITLTVPSNAEVAFEIGTQIEGSQAGAGQVTITPGAGVTINAVPGLKVAAQYGVFGLLKVGTDTWLAYGRLSA